MKPVALLLFSKSPDSPEAKTRLRKENDACTNAFIQDLHRSFVFDSLRLIEEVPATQRFAFWYPHIPKKLTSSFLTIQHQKQKGEDFHQRIDHALQSVSQKTNLPILLIGSDCPYLTPDLLSKACFHIQNGAGVIGPVKKGGVYLVGIPTPTLISPAVKCFGGPDELHQFQEIFSSTEPVILPFLSDIDELEDLSKLLSWAKDYKEKKQDFAPTKTLSCLQGAKNVTVQGVADKARKSMHLFTGPSGADME